MRSEDLVETKVAAELLLKMRKTERAIRSIPEYSTIFQLSRLHGFEVNLGYEMIRC